MRRVIVRGVRTWPDPLHVRQGCSTTVPLPPHFGQVWRTWKNPAPPTTAPRPWHVGHVTRFEPAAAPVPWQSGHWSGTVMFIVRVLPKTASSKSISISIVMSAPCWGPLGSA